jgi:hypothetical protein
MKIIFLDFDGVLVRFGDNDPKTLYSLTKECVSNLNLIIEKVPEVKIVITSTWRMVRKEHELIRILINDGFKHPRSIIDVTPVLNWNKITNRRSTRGDEIKLWLKDKVVESFVIIDDDSDMDPFMDHLVQTKVKEGLTNEITDKVIQILNN